MVESTCQTTSELVNGDWSTEYGYLVTLSPCSQLILCSPQLVGSDYRWVLCAASLYLSELRKYVSRFLVWI